MSNEHFVAVAGASLRISQRLQALLQQPEALQRPQHEAELLLDAATHLAYMAGHASGLISLINERQAARNKCMDALGECERIANATGEQPEQLRAALHRALDDARRALIAPEPQPMASAGGALHE